MIRTKYIIAIFGPTGPRFWVSGHKWSNEYPDAGTFYSLRDAIQTAKQFGSQAVVVGDYGLDTESQHENGARLQYSAD